MLVTIVELPEYIKQANRLLRENERDSILFQLALHPRSGVLIQGTGGVRKLRWSLKGKGKSGGVRVIYFFHNESMPLHLLTVFSKDQTANINRAERNELKKLVKELVKTHKKRNK